MTSPNGSSPRLPGRDSKSNYRFVKEAYKSYKKKKYNDSILLLKKVIDSGIKVPYPYFLLSISYLMINQFNKSDSMMKRIRMIDPKYMPFIQLEAFLCLKSSPDRETILSRYVDLLDTFPDNMYINKGVSALRKIHDFNSFQRDARLHDFVAIPKPAKDEFAVYHTSDSQTKKSRGIFNKYSISAAIVLFLSIILILLYRFAPGYKIFDTRMKRNTNSKEKIDLITLDAFRYELIDKISRKKTPVFYYSSQQIKSDFTKAKKLIKKNELNRALILLNSLNNSNANFMVKQRVEFLIKFIADIEERDFEKIEFKRVQKKPYLYKGVSVHWRGKIANLKRKNSSLLFNLLVDYRDSNLFSGISDVYSGQNYKNLKNGDMVNVKALFVYTLGSENRINLVAKDIVKL